MGWILIVSWVELNIKFKFTNLKYQVCDFLKITKQLYSIGDFWCKYINSMKVEASLITLHKHQWLRRRNYYECKSKNKIMRIWEKFFFPYRCDAGTDLYETYHLYSTGSKNTARCRHIGVLVRPFPSARPDWKLTLNIVGWCQVRNTLFLNPRLSRTASILSTYSYNRVNVAHYSQMRPNQPFRV